MESQQNIALKSSPPASTLPQMRRYRRGLFVGFGSVVLLALPVIYIPLSIWLYADHDETRKADAAIILGAAVYRSVPSPVFQERIRHGVDLYKRGFVQKLIFTGGKNRYDDAGEAEAARTSAIVDGVPAQDIILENKSATTWENLKFSVPLLKKEKLKSVLIVSDPMHMRRSMSMAHDLGIQAFSSPTPTTLYRSGKTRWEFLKYETKFYSVYLLRRLLGIEAGIRT